MGFDIVESFGEQAAESDSNFEPRCPRNSNTPKLVPFGSTGLGPNPLVQAIAGLDTPGRGLSDWLQNLL